MNNVRESKFSGSKTLEQEMTRGCRSLGSKLYVEEVDLLFHGRWKSKMDQMDALSPDKWEHVGIVLVPFHVHGGSLQEAWYLCLPEERIKPSMRHAGQTGLPPSLPACPWIQMNG